MNLQCSVRGKTVLTLLVCACLASGQLHARGLHPAPGAVQPPIQQSGLAGRALHSTTTQDPFEPVYIVTSRDTYRSQLQAMATDAVSRTDSIGNMLVVSRIAAHQLPDLARRIHENENRCGGFFAFESRARADHFIRSDRAAQALVSQPLAAYTIDNHDTVDPWLPQVSASNIHDTIADLSSFRNRYYSSSYGKSAAESIRDSWQALGNGRSDVSAELFTGCSNCSTQPSVILTIQGAELPNEIVVLGAHLDSINGSAGGSSSQNAPGADDDGSGIATLTEVLRIALADGWKPKRTIKFMGYAAEEVGLRGSNAIAQSFKSSGKDVVGVLQLDMTNYKTGTGVDMQLITDYSNSAMKQYLLDLFDAYLAPLGLTRGSYTCGYGCSDHASWTSAGYPSAMMFEAGDGSGGYNPYIHSANDTLATMGDSAANSTGFAKLGLAFLGELGKTAAEPPPPGGNVLGRGVPETGLSAARGSDVLYTMTVPSGASDLTFSMSGGSGDGDLYVKFGSAPTDSSYDCRPYQNGSSESCSFASPFAGTYYVRVKAYAAFSGLSLLGDYSTGSGGGGCGGAVLCSGAALSLPSVARNSTSLTYRLFVPPGTSAVISISGGSGDADLYVKQGSAPTTSSYDCRPYKAGNSESCSVSTTGTYYIKVRAYRAFSGVSLKGTVSP